MSEPIIVAEGLTKTYGPVNACDNVTFVINRGDILGLVGKNGAGKTTLIRMLTNLAKPTRGTFTINTSGPRTDTSVAALVEKPSFFGNMTGMDNMICQCKLLGVPVNKAHCAETLRLVGLEPTLATKSKNYSLGMRQRLAIALALVGGPELLILDEPTNGLDPQGIYEMRELFVKLNREMGVTLLISSHILSELGKFATNYVFMDKGHVVKEITNEDLLKECQKALRLHVSDPDLANKLLSDKYQVRIGSDFVEVLDENATVSDVVATLAAANVTVSNVSTVGNNLEDYYLNLIGGGAR